MTAPSAPLEEAIDLDEAQERLSGVLKQVSAERRRIVVEREGRPVGAIVSIDDLRRLQKLDADIQRGIEALNRIGEAFADVPLEELEREVERAVAEAREELRAERAAASSR